MAPTLTLFPSPQSSTGLSRRSSLRRLQTDKAPNANGQMQLNGVAFQVLSSPKVQPAPETFQHSLFCNPAPASTNSPSAGSATPIRRQSRTRRRSSPVTSPMPSTGDPASPAGDTLTELPLNTNFGPNTSPKRSRSLLKRPSKPNNISTQVSRVMEFASPVDEKKDAVSPLPDKTRFQPSSLQTEYGKSLSQSPARSPGQTPPMRSMFPRYDPSRALDEQQYYPTTRAPPPDYSSPVSLHEPSPIQRSELKRFDSAVGLVDRYEHIPAAGHADLEALWKASIESFPCEGRKVQFSLFQPCTNSKSLAIGTSREDIIYSMEREDDPTHKSYSLKKHCPTAPSSSPVSQLILPGPDTKKPQETAIFPQMAAMSAIEAISNSPQAAEIAIFDPSASSPEAARLAQDAVATAHQNYSCDLIKRTRQREGSIVTASYDLKHPSLGTFAVTVTKSNSQGPHPRAKISLHHPSATPAAIAADTLNLAFLDFAHDAAVLDIPGLLGLDAKFLIDTVVSTLFAVAVIENEELVREQITFAPPPKMPVVATASKKSERRTSVGSSLSFSTKKKGWFSSKKVKETTTTPIVEEPEQVELPGFGRAVVGLSWMAVKGAFWVMGTGVKVGVKIVKEVRNA